jgi:hypothetical protein
MKKIFPFLVFSFILCTDPSSSINYSKVIIGNWYEWRRISRENINGQWQSDTVESTMENTKNVRVITDDLIESYVRLNPSGYQKYDYIYTINKNQIIMVDPTSNTETYKLSYNDDVLFFEKSDSSTVTISQFKDYTDSIPPPWK